LTATGGSQVLATRNRGDRHAVIGVVGWHEEHPACKEYHISNHQRFFGRPSRTWLITGRLNHIKQQQQYMRDYVFNNVFECSEFVAF